ncbi:hypothetical protein [Pseudooceanicola onchidii]|uniref:hypothetical protein n=1 Tax=Pseudooceanicola onchidii TaxID=2562279 RepID=UPI0010AAEA91|nr:hypothetical protein [Pseudooceanicola onchidii]
MKILQAICVALALIAPLSAQAQTQDTAEGPQVAPQVIDRLWQVLDIPASLAIMREEGQGMADSVAQDYLPGRPGSGWQADTADIYDPAAMDGLMRSAFAEDFAGTDPEPIFAFFDGDLGTRIIGLELSARRAFLDDDTENMARDRIRGGSVPVARLAMIDDFIAANDLIEFNLSGALNTNFAFLSGLAEAEVFRMSEGEILARVYENAEDTRADTTEWLQAYLTMAYQPLSDDELQAYIDFSRLPEGQRLNRALFAGFGKMYDQQYHALGLAVARQLGAQEL